MTNDRNISCHCGSGKKYKKCCLNKGSASGSMPISNYLREKLDKPCWFHGTNQHFDSWLIPPPPKPGEDLLVPHTAIFFTSDLDFAKGAGNKIAKVTLSSNGRILDAIENYEASERLRLSLRNHQIASRTLNSQHDFWHAGWRTGDVLRMAFADPALVEHLQNVAANLSRQSGLPIEAANVAIQHNTARGLIELICTSAKRLGFDAIFGHEVDRHSFKDKVIAQPWLAVLSKGIVSEPEWV